MNTLEQGIQILKDGGIVAFPTETVYGLGGDATQSSALQKIYKVKGRPSHNPLILHFWCLDQIEDYALVTDTVRRLASAFWPGPMTLLLTLKPGTNLSPLANAGLPSIAVRIPGNPLALDLLKGVGRPIAAPSANTSGRISPTCADHVRQDLGDKIDLIINGGASTVGIESTIIDLTGPHPCILRPGSLTSEDIRTVIDHGEQDPRKTNNSLTAPGQLLSHYAPKKPLRLNVSVPNQDECYIGFGPQYPAALNLSESADLREAAHNLYAFLHHADQSPFPRIAIAPLPQSGLGVALQDRLGRASWKEIE